MEDYADEFDEDYGCDCSMVEIDILDGTAQCLRCRRHWPASSAEIAAEIRWQAEYSERMERDSTHSPNRREES